MLNVKSKANLKQLKPKLKNFGLQTISKQI